MIPTKYFIQKSFRSIIILLSLVIICHSNTYSQNFIQNGSFEDFTACPDAVSQLDLCKNWFSPSEAATPDYFNNCSPMGCNVGVPENFAASNLNAHSGNGYAGFITINTFEDIPPPNYREYISTEINDSLKSGKIYNLNCSVALSTASILATNLGFNFSTSQIEQSDQFEILLPPATITIPPILDTNWVDISIQFVGDRDYKFLTIGYFDENDDENIIDVIFPKSKCIPQIEGYVFSYYLIDDISITESTSTPDLCVLDEEKPGLQINKLSNDLYDIMITYKDSNMTLEDIGYDEIVEIIACHKVCRDLTFDASNFSFVDHCDMMDDLSRGAHFDVLSAADYDAMKYYTSLEESRYFSEFIVRMTIEECVKI